MKQILTIFLSLLTTTFIEAQSCHESGPQPHAMAPIGVMGGHTHSKGHFMASYRYMPMKMSGMAKRDIALSSENVLQSYMMAPTSMMMQMHMIGVMYAPANRITLSVMTSYRTSSMQMDSEASHTMVGGEHDHSTMHDMSAADADEPMVLTSSSMKNQGFGDTKIAALIRLNQDTAHCLHAIIGAQIPTGSINASDEMHAILPYGMQNGTGSTGAFLGLNYSWIMSKYLIGSQFMSKAPLHENSRGYISPVMHDVSFWASRKLTYWMSSSFRIKGHYQTGIRGSDVLIDPMMSPAGVNINEELAYSEAALGLNLRPFDQWRIGLEAAYPFYQYNFGTHMNHSWSLVAGLQFMMH